MVFQRDNESQFSTFLRGFRLPGVHFRIFHPLRKFIFFESFLFIKAYSIQWHAGRDGKSGMYPKFVRDTPIFAHTSLSKIVVIVLNANRYRIWGFGKEKSQFFTYRRLPKFKSKQITLFFLFEKASKFFVKIYEDFGFAFFLLIKN